MNHVEIATKSDLTQQEMEWLVMEYIKEKKGVDIGSIVYKRGGFVSHIELGMLFDAFLKAAEYYGKDKGID